MVNPKKPMRDSAQVAPLDVAVASGRGTKAVDLVVSVKRRLQFRSARRPTVYPLRLPSWPAGA